MLQLLFTIALGWSIQADDLRFPQNPDAQLTPGSTCQHPDEYRYPERIPYCERHVSKSTKWAVIHAYNQRGNYNIDRNDRAQFKIDHRIPLCMGGSNQVDNLWPQHQTVYVITDKLEEVACQKMAFGRLKQARAIELLTRAKLHLNEAPAILREIEAL